MKIFRVYISESFFGLCKEGISSDQVHLECFTGLTKFLRCTNAKDTLIKLDPFDVKEKKWA